MADLHGAVLLDDPLAAIAYRGAKEAMDKALALPPGTRTQDLAPQAGQIASQSPEGTYVPMPRTDPQVPFGPGSPFIPVPWDPRIVGGPRPAPRVSDFPTAVNLNLNDRLVPFSVLVEAASQVDVLRRCLEVRKAHIVGLQWGFRVTDWAMKRIMATEGVPLGKAAKIARDDFATPIADAEEFWRSPDRGQDFDFAEWLGMVIEQWLTIDALTVWPHPTLGGTIDSFEVIDGATIKPLRNYRGAIPTPPSPAYQQILKGFPRGEFAASPADQVDGQWSGDELIYRPRTRRPGVTPYGFSNIEQALSSADLYLKRMAWIRAEFTDGVLPTTNVETDATWSPEELISYEQAFNDRYAGQIQERHRVHLWPKGFAPKQATEWAEKYNTNYDEFLIKIFCMNMGVMPTEIGFTPKTGIGGKGYSEGEESSTYRKSIRPDVQWLSGVINKLAHIFTGLPEEVEFTFVGYQQEDQFQLAQQEETLLKSGQHTINEGRSSRGEPLWDIPEADTPMIQTATGLVFVEGQLDAQADAEVAPPAPAPAAGGEPGAPAAAEAPPASAVGGDQAGEVAKFLRYADKRQGRAWRPFVFDRLDTFTADRFNELGAAGDLDGIKVLAADVGKALALA